MLSLFWETTSLLSYKDEYYRTSERGCSLWMILFTPQDLLLLCDVSDQDGLKQRPLFGVNSLLLAPQ